MPRFFANVHMLLGTNAAYKCANVFVVECFRPACKRAPIYLWRSDWRSLTALGCKRRPVYLLEELSVIGSMAPPYLFTPGRYSSQHRRTMIILQMFIQGMFAAEMRLA